MLRDLRGWPTPAPILAAAAALDFGVVTYMIVRRLDPPPPGSRAPPQVTRRMAAAGLGAGRPGQRAGGHFASEGSCPQTNAGSLNHAAGRNRAETRALLTRAGVLATS